MGGQQQAWEIAPLYRVFRSLDILCTIRHIQGGHIKYGGTATRCCGQQYYWGSNYLVSYELVGNWIP